MKPDYKNWVPRGMLIGTFAGAGVCGTVSAVTALTGWLDGGAKVAVYVIFGVLCLLLLFYGLFSLHLYTTFSYTGKKQLARRIIQKISDYVVLPENGIGLDVGCGSGALTIACAKKNAHASMTGLDRWGREYASFNQLLCRQNAEAEGVSANTEFVQGDACRLNFPDETFDAVTSNYCYHNIPSANRQDILLETLRVLKKGGTFAIHDWFTPAKYGDMQQMLTKLKAMGYEKAELLPTDNGLFMTQKEAGSVCLKGSALLLGKK